MTRETRGTAKCGWCITNDHKHCKKVIDHYGRNVACPCVCNDTPKK